MGGWNLTSRKIHTGKSIWIIGGGRARALFQKKKKRRGENVIIHSKCCINRAWITGLNHNQVADKYNAHSHTLCRKKRQRSRRQSLDDAHHTPRRQPNLHDRDQSPRSALAPLPSPFYVEEPISPPLPLTPQLPFLIHSLHPRIRSEYWHRQSASQLNWTLTMHPRRWLMYWTIMNFNHLAINGWHSNWEKNQMNKLINKSNAATFLISFFRKEYYKAYLLDFPS